MCSWRWRTALILLLVAGSTAALAQEALEEAPDILPPAPLTDDTPLAKGYTTKTDEAEGTLPWKALPKNTASPFTKPDALTTKKPEAKPKSNAIPFGKPSSDIAQPIPAGPRMMQAVPVPGVDAVQITEPAAPSTAPLVANPAEESPATPTQETAPIFSAENAVAPRLIVFRALNKVTGQAEEIRTKPAEEVRFGKLEIHPITCQESDPNSQRDHAGLFELYEHAPGSEDKKPLFKGWMYASSPSITSLEHPIYDITMVECFGFTSARAGDDSSKDLKKKDTKKSDDAERNVSPSDAISED